MPEDRAGRVGCVPGCCGQVEIGLTPVGVGVGAVGVGVGAVGAVDVAIPLPGR